MPKENRHGGDLDDIARAYGVPKEHLINFSGNVNPLGVPETVREAVCENIHMLAGYPDADYVSLRESIGCYAGVHRDNIIVGNGATELISLYIQTQLRQPAASSKKAVILAPSYSEYQREVNKSGLECVLFPLREEDGFRLNLLELLELLDSSVCLLVVCNPNNPTGSAVRHMQMEKILTHCARFGVKVMVDETYAEFSDSEDIITAPLIIKHRNLFTVRGTSKFFAVPGLRLGYGLCGDSSVLDMMNENKDPWSVSALAEAAGRVMFSDTAYINATKRLISAERAKMQAELKSWRSIRLYESHANFLLIRLLESCPLTSGEIFEKMIQRHLVIRDCKGFLFLDERFIRVCVMGPEENELLLSCLKPIIEGE